MILDLQNKVSWTIPVLCNVSVIYEAISSYLLKMPYKDANTKLHHVSVGLTSFSKQTQLNKATNNNLLVTTFCPLLGFFIVPSSPAYTEISLD